VDRRGQKKKQKDEFWETKNNDWGEKKNLEVGSRGSDKESLKHNTKRNTSVVRQKREAQKDMSEESIYERIWEKNQREGGSHRWDNIGNLVLLKGKNKKKTHLDKRVAIFGVNQ